MFNIEISGRWTEYRGHASWVVPYNHGSDASRFPSVRRIDKTHCLLLVQLLDIKRSAWECAVGHVVRHVAGDTFVIELLDTSRSSGEQVLDIHLDTRTEKEFEQSLPCKSRSKASRRAAVGQHHASIVCCRPSTCMLESVSFAWWDVQLTPRHRRQPQKSAVHQPLGS